MVLDEEVSASRGGASKPIHSAVLGWAQVLQVSRLVALPRIGRLLYLESAAKSSQTIGKLVFVLLRYALS
jgi:hypothetical protein